MNLIKHHSTQYSLQLSEETDTFLSTDVVASDDVIDMSRRRDWTMEYEMVHSRPVYKPIPHHDVLLHHPAYRYTAKSICLHIKSTTQIVAQNE